MILVWLQQHSPESVPYIITSRVYGRCNVFVVSLCVCLSVCLSVWIITFEAVDIETSYLV